MRSTFKIGPYIEQLYIHNSDLKYGEEDAIGVNISKEIRPMRGNISEKDFRKFFLVPPGCFAYNPRGGRKLGIGYNDTSKVYIITFNCIVFRVNSLGEEVIDPEFLFMYLCRKEWDRKAEYLSWGSSTEVFSWETLCDVELPEIDIREQHNSVDAWKSLRNIKELNESLSATLMQLCLSYIQECKHKYPLEELRHFITEVNERNVDEVYSVEDVRGLATSKEIIPTKASMGGVSVKSYKVFRPEQFAFVDDTSRRGDRMSLAVNMSDDTYIVSSISTIVNITDKQKLLPQFLKLWFDRSEFDRYARFHSWGSARESFTFEDMQRVRIPIPPIDVQRAVVSLYQCALEYKAIAAEADEQAKKICSPLLQQLIHQS